MKARHEWIQASEFHPLSDREVLDRVLGSIRDHAKRGDKSVLLLDLDSTLYEVQPRTLQILREWAQDPAHGAKFAREFTQPITKLEPARVGYSLKDTFAAAGLAVESHPEVEAAWISAKDYWQKRFFHDEYVKYDRPYPGAAEFVHSADRAGTEIVYLTGRDEPNMGRGTRDALKHDGFPVGHSRIHYLLKKHAAIEDQAHKTEAARSVEKLGILIASFENEPRNLMALQSVFPDSMHVFVETVFSDHPAPIGRGLYRIRSFV